MAALPSSAPAATEVAPSAAASGRTAETVFIVFGLQDGVNRAMLNHKVGTLTARVSRSDDDAGRVHRVRKRRTRIGVY